MPCRLCDGPDHPTPGIVGAHALMNCPHYVRVPQPLKELIRNVWSNLPPGIAAGVETAGWIYDNCYANNGGLDPNWTHWFNGDPRGVTEERIYMAVHGNHLLTVWDALVPYFEANRAHDVRQAKRCHPDVAGRRPDAIVVYLRNKAAVWRMEDELRRLLSESEIEEHFFRRVVPPGTGKSADLTGVATAFQPADDSSFGQTLTSEIASAYDTFNRPVRLPTSFDFMTVCLSQMHANGINIFKPWNRPLQVF